MSPMQSTFVGERNMQIYHHGGFMFFSAARQLSNNASQIPKTQMHVGLVHEVSRLEWRSMVIIIIIAISNKQYIFFKSIVSSVRQIYP